MSGGRPPNVQPISTRRATDSVDGGQQKLMLFDPVTGAERPYPSHAAQYRAHHGRVAWLFNPWSGNRRDGLEIGLDVCGERLLP